MPTFIGDPTSGANKINPVIPSPPFLGIGVHLLCEMVGRSECWCMSGEVSFSSFSSSGGKHKDSEAVTLAGHRPRGGKKRKNGIGSVAPTVKEGPVEGAILQAFVVEPLPFVPRVYAGVRHRRRSRLMTRHWRGHIIPPGSSILW